MEGMGVSCLFKNVHQLEKTGDEKPGRESIFITAGQKECFKTHGGQKEGEKSMTQPCSRI
jgi:hypothetical protein